MSKIDLNRALVAALALHEHACTVGCRLADGGDCNADGLDDADHAAAARLLHKLDHGDAPAWHWETPATRRAEVSGV